MRELFNDLVIFEDELLNKIKIGKIQELYCTDGPNCLPISLTITTIRKIIMKGMKHN